MRRLVVLTALSVVVAGACHKYSDRLKDGGPDDETTGEGEGEGSPCPNAAMFAQTTLANDTADTQLIVHSNDAPVVLFGPPSGDSFASLKGYFEIQDYPANAKVTAQVVTKSCATSGCVTTIGFRFFGTQNLTNQSDGTCGSATVSADAAGVIDIRMTGGGTGGGSGGGNGLGPQGPDTGLLLTPQ
jgi:hypothetical protein